MMTLFQNYRPPPAGRYARKRISLKPIPGSAHTAR